MAGIKVFNVRLNKDLWSFIKKKGVDREMSINEMIIELVTKYKNKCENKSEKKLTDNDAMV